MSFDIALTGLNAVTTQLDAISHNIANVGTTGFKSSRVNFGSIYADQQAMGVEVTGSTQSISQGGALTATNRSLDLAISGGGFFVTRAANGDVSYTRAGVFGVNADGNIANNLGQRLQGYLADANGNLQTGRVSDLRLNTGNLPARASTAVDFVANLNADHDVITAEFSVNNPDSYNSTYTTEVYDSLGRAHAVTQYFVKTDEGEWDVYYAVEGQPVGTAADTPPTPNHQLSFDPMGILNAGAEGTLSFNPPGAAAVNLELNYGGTTQTGSPFAVTTNRPDGYPPGERTGLQVGDDGSVFATYSNGQRMLQGKVVLASFANPEGLRNVNGTAWVETTASGTALVGAPGSGQYGAINSGNLENSNVDLTEQLVGLMEGQRNYQANSRVIATQRELSQILFSSM